MQRQPRRQRAGLARRRRRRLRRLVVCMTCYRVTAPSGHQAVDFGEEAGVVGAAAGPAAMNRQVAAIALAALERISHATAVVQPLLQPRCAFCRALVTGKPLVRLERANGG